MQLGNTPARPRSVPAAAAAQAAAVPGRLAAGSPAAASRLLLRPQAAQEQQALHIFNTSIVMPVAKMQDQEQLRQGHRAKALTWLRQLVEDPDGDAEQEALQAQEERGSQQGCQMLALEVRPEKC